MTNGVFDLRKVIRAGLIAGLVMIFTSAIGMVEDFDGRQIVDQLLSLGFLALFWFVPRAGYSVGSEEVLEGMEAHDKSTTNVVAGALVGLVAGLSLSVFVIITNALDLRDVFTRLSPKLVAVLTFSDNVADPNLVTGILILIAISVLLGAIGGALHLVSDRLRKQIVWAVLGVVVAALLEDVFAQILRTFGLTSVVRSVYRNGALRIAPAVVVSVASFFIAGRKQRGGSAVRKYLAVADPKERTKRSVIVAAVALAIIAVAPWVLGSLLSEILATTGIFLLMGLG
ncbi:MAG: hypothetical protein KJN63_04070, partial [Acidimicrobiia bacterium]|nr:hypothetical protein [Acidimicrobiia bacterium]